MLLFIASLVILAVAVVLLISTLGIRRLIHRQLFQIGGEYKQVVQEYRQMQRWCDGIQKVNVAVQMENDSIKKMLSQVKHESDERYAAIMGVISPGHGKYTH